MAEDAGRDEQPGGGDDSASPPDEPILVTLLVCLECGKEYRFENAEQPPEDLTCEKCGNTVFRTFEDEAHPGEAREDFEESTERETATDDPGGDVTPGDLHDLNAP